MKLLVYNVGRCSGIRGTSVLEYACKTWKYLFKNRKITAAIANLLNEVNADIAYLAEVNNGKFANQHSSIFQNTPYNEAVFFSKCHDILQALPIVKRNGCSIYSKQSFSGASIGSFSKGMVKKFYFTHQPHPGITVFFVHLPLRFSARKRCLTDLQQAIKSIAGSCILLGDFNTYRGTQELQELMENCNLKSANINSIPTFPSLHARHELDYILLSDDIDIQSFEIIPSELSDHLPLVVELAVPAT